MMTDPPKRAPGRPRDETLWARRQDEILDAAVKVFAERGYPNTDVQLIADAVQVSKGTLYRYFPSKEELFLAAVDRGLYTLNAAMEAAMGHIADPLDRLRVGLRTYLAFSANQPEHVELLMQERAAFRDRPTPTYFLHHDEHVKPWLAIFRELIAAGRVRALPPEQIVTVLSNVVYGTMFTNYFTPRPRSYEAQAREIVDIVFHGILTPAERRRRAETTQEKR